MAKLEQDMDRFLSTLAGDKDLVRVNRRARQVRERYKAVMESVYRSTAQLFLEHTNNVYIMNKNDVRTLIVYVDDSIFAAELNAQRELIKLKLLEQFGEKIEEFEIYISRGRYKDNHPFLLEQYEGETEALVLEQLDETELDYVDSTASNVESKEVRNAFEKAMKAAMALNKTEKGKTS